MITSHFLKDVKCGMQGLLPAADNMLLREGTTWQHVKNSRIRVYIFH